MYDTESSSSNNSLASLLRGRRLPNCTVFVALRSTPNPGKLGLEALRLFYPSYSIEDAGNLSVMRRNCVVLLEDLKSVMSSVEPEVRKEAIEMALDWQSKMKNNALEVLGFLTLVDVFRLVGEFDKDGIFEHFDSIVWYEQAPQLLRGLGFSDNATDFVQKLIESNKIVEAIPFINAFKLADKFPLVPLLKEHAAFAEAKYEQIYNNENNSLIALDNATSALIRALRDVLNVIKNYKLEYSAGDVTHIRKQIMQLRKQLDNLKAAETSEFQKQVQISPKPSIQPEGDNLESLISNNSLLPLFRERRLQSYNVFDALRSMPNPGKLALEALRLFYPSKQVEDDAGIGLDVVRRNCVVLLEELKRVMRLVEPEVRKEAIVMALDWRSKMKKDALEVLVFLMLVDGFQLMDEFDRDGIFQHFDAILHCKQAPHLLRDLGFSDKANDFVQKLIDSNKRLEAIRLICALELVDKFPPVPLLEAHRAFAETKYASICADGKSSSSPLDNATRQLIGALRGIMRVIKRKKLQCSLRDKRKRISQLRKQLDDLKTAETSEVQKQVQVGNKSEASSKPQLGQQNTEKRLKMAEPAAAFPSPNAATQTPVKPNPPSFSLSCEKRANFSLGAPMLEPLLRPTMLHDPPKLLNLFNSPFTSSLLSLVMVF